MFRAMRRSVQQLSDAECVEILNRCTNGVLSVSGDDGYPYGVPVSYAYDNGKLYFHCAKVGHKLDAIAGNEKVCFTVVDLDRVIPEKLTTAFRSVIAFGTAKVLTDPAEKLRTHILFSDKYAHDFPKETEEEIKSGLDRMEMVEITIQHMTGKEGIELTRARKKA